MSSDSDADRPYEGVTDLESFRENGREAVSPRNPVQREIHAHGN